MLVLALGVFLLCCCWFWGIFIGGVTIVSGQISMFSYVCCLVCLFIHIVLSIFQEFLNDNNEKLIRCYKRLAELYKRKCEILEKELEEGVK